jgi:hypothetical protein
VAGIFVLFKTTFKIGTVGEDGAAIRFGMAELAKDGVADVLDLGRDFVGDHALHDRTGRDELFRACDERGRQKKQRCGENALHWDLLNARAFQKKLWPNLRSLGFAVTIV